MKLINQFLDGTLPFSEIENFKNELRTFIAQAKNGVANSIRLLTDAFVAEAKARKIPLYYTNEYGVDSDIFGWLPNATDNGDGLPRYKSTKLPKDGMMEGEMLKTALKLPLAQGIKAMTAKLKAGYFDEKKKIFIIYLTDSKDGVPLELVGHRNGDGKLDLYVYEVSESYHWDTSGLVVEFLSNPL